MASALIGIMGLKQSGKDTFAARLVAEHGFTRYALADPMRDFALALDPIVYADRFGEVYRLSRIVEDIGWDAAKETFPEVRRTLQRLGTEAGRGVLGEDFWINVTHEKLQANPGPVVITDIRFPNEYDYVSDHGGHLVRVIRPGQTSTDQHLSERLARDLDNYPADLTVINGSTIETLHGQADLFIRALGATRPPDDMLF